MGRSVADRVVYTGFDTEFGGPLSKFRDFLASKGIETNIISGVRTDEDQRQLVANRNATLAGTPLPYPDRGPVHVAAPVGSSAHEYGEAADVEPVNPADAAAMHKYAKQFGLRMPNWGGADPYHVQLKNWQDAAATQAPPTPWNTIPDIPTQYASNVADASTPSTGGFKIPGTTITIGGGAPVAGALSETGPESSNAGGGAAKPGEPMDNRQIIFNRLTGTGLGLKPYQALGAMWAFGGESGGSLNTGAYNPKDPGGAIGFGQWVGDRRSALEDLAKGAGTPWTDINTQNDHLFNELTNKNYATYQPGVLDALRNAKTSEEAARIVTAKFERPKVDNSDERIKRGAAVGSLDADGNFVPGTAKAIVAGSGPASTGPTNTNAPDASTSPSGQQAADNQSLFGRFTQGPIDPATGKPDPNKTTPMQSIMDAVLNSRKNTLAKVDEAGPEKTALSNQPAPMARNVSPMGGALLPNVPQTYGQTLNSFARPLTYNAAPPQAPQMAAAGFQGGFGSQGPGISLNSLPAVPMGSLGQIRPLTLDEYGYQGAGYAS